MEHHLPSTIQLVLGWLVSLLNLGKGILSSNENYLLFGANCSEDCIPVKRFISMFISINSWLR
jgi:hypothetical protein